MFVLANGAFKSGSTWLHTILKETGAFERLPEAFCMDPAVSRHWLKPERVKAFLDSGIYHHSNYLAKGHHFERGVRELFLAHDDVYVLNIKRDLKDSLVAHFYHLIRQNKLSEDLARPERRRRGFNDYYWRFGRYKAQQIMDYHRVWDAPSPRVYVSSFERLKTDFGGEVNRVGLFLGLELSAEEISALQEKTRLETLQKSRGQSDLPEHKRFFRKGLVGEWEGYFDDATLADVEKIEARGLGTFDMLRYRAVFGTLALRRRWLGR